MIDHIKRVIFYFFNPKKRPFRTSDGKIIDDFRSKRHSKKTQKALESGELTRPGYDGVDENYKKGEQGKCFQVQTKRSVTAVRLRPKKQEV